MPDSNDTNDEFTAFWNNVLVAKFERFRDILQRGLSFHSDVPLRDLKLAPGAHALDVGCGWGDTAIELARIVGPTGRVLGIDCCEKFLASGRQDARAAGVRNVELVAANVQTYRFEREFDFCFSRFGMMFFASPVAAMSNLRTALKPGAPFMFIVWRTLADNAWLRLPKEITLAHLPRPGDDAQSCGPGPFSMADPAVVTAQLDAAGFVDAKFERVDGPVRVGSTLDEAVAFQLAIGPAGEIVREAGKVGEARRAEVEQALKDALAPHLHDGAVVMASSSWTITARNPG
jgi:ubiquinone/menaquinone biosynthesis C-methylase UbiE